MKGVSIIGAFCVVVLGTSWAVGQTVIDQAALPIPSDAPKGTYRVEIAVYNESTIENLPAGGPGAQDILLTVGDVEVY